MLGDWGWGWKFPTASDRVGGNCATGAFRELHHSDVWCGVIAGQRLGRLGFESLHSHKISLLAASSWAAEGRDKSKLHELPGMISAFQSKCSQNLGRQSPWQEHRSLLLCRCGTGERKEVSVCWLMNPKPDLHPMPTAIPV